jgi:predicted transglutaminase-like cysteine proteinase
MRFILFLIVFISFPSYGSDFAVLSKVNREVNRSIKYTSDINQYGKKDYHASPEETLKSKKGDCEDYAILKQRMLANKGYKSEVYLMRYSPSLVRINDYVREDHAVLVVKSGGREYILDNNTDEILHPQYLRNFEIVKRLK